MRNRVKETCIRVKVTYKQAAEAGCKDAERQARGAEVVVKSTEGEREELARKVKELDLAKRETEMQLEGERGDAHINACVCVVCGVCVCVSVCLSVCVCRYAQYTYMYMYIYVFV